MIKKLFD